MFVLSTARITATMGNDFYQMESSPPVPVSPGNVVPKKLL